MTTILNSSPSGEIQSNATDTTIVVQPQATPEQLAQIEADKLALQSEYTKTRQALIEYASKVASDDPSTIAGIKDTKLQNSVVKQLYGFDTYAQAVAVLGSELNAATSGNESDDRTAVLERELKLLKYNSQKSTIENEIKNYKLSNPQYFVSADSEEKLLAELEFISGNLPVSERIRRAATIAFIPSVDPTTDAYRTLTMGIAGSGGNAKMDTNNVKESEKQKQIEAGRKLF